jgi:hypothetical protein
MLLITIQNKSVIHKWQLSVNTLVGGKQFKLANTDKHQHHKQRTTYAVSKKASLQIATARVQRGHATLDTHIISLAT